MSRSAFLQQNRSLFPIKFSDRTKQHRRLRELRHFLKDTLTPALRRIKKFYICNSRIQSLGKHCGDTRISARNDTDLFRECCKQRDGFQEILYLQTKYWSIQQKSKCGIMIIATVEREYICNVPLIAGGRSHLADSAQINTPNAVWICTGTEDTESR